MVGTIVGSYRLTRLLGEGGMGAVYEALNDALERRVAIKILHPDFARQPDVVNRFFNEARAVNRIAHPSLVQVHEFGYLPNGTAFIVMEFLSGETVAKRLAGSGGTLPIKTALQIAWQVAAALTAAHEKDIIHRDLKPANLMLVPDPLGPGGERVKVLDFGIAKLAADTKHGQTATKVIMGTPAYMSPEQCRGAGTVDSKTDVYALGCILYELLTGRTPFVSEGAGELMALQMFQAVQPVRSLAPTVHPEIAAYIERLLHKDRSQRPSMREVTATLAQLIEKLSSAGSSPESLTVSFAVPDADNTASPSTTGHSRGQRRPSPPQHRPLVSVLSALVVSLLVGGVGLWATMREPDRGPVRVGFPPGTTGHATAGIVDGTAERTLPPPKLVLPPDSPSPKGVAAVNPQPGPRWTGRGVGGRKGQPTATSRAAAPTEDDDSAAATATAPVAVPPPEVKPAGPDPALEKAKFEKILQQAQAEYVKGNYDIAIETARPVTKHNPSFAWLLIGSAACKSKNLNVATEAYNNLDAKGKEHIKQECLNKHLEYTERGFQKIIY